LWSPQQIAEHLPLNFPDDPEMRVSHETIYQSLFAHVAGSSVVSWLAVFDRGALHAANEEQPTDGDAFREWS